MTLSPDILPIAGTNVTLNQKVNTTIVCANVRLMEDEIACNHVEITREHRGKKRYLYVVLLYTKRMSERWDYCCRLVMVYGLLLRYWLKEMGHCVFC